LYHLSSEFREISESINQKASLLQSTLDDEICPGLKISDVTNTTQDISNLGDFIEDDFKNNLNTVLDKAQNMSSFLQRYKLRGWHVWIFVMPIIVLSYIMIIGTIVAYTYEVDNWLQCFLMWVILPLFITNVTFLWLLSCLFSIGAIVNADVCSGGDEISPEGTIQEIIENQEIDKDSHLYRGILYYINVSKE